MITNIDTLNGTDLTVDEVYLRVNDVCGTLYHGDADIISDYLSSPQGELDVYGLMHHIHMAYARGEFVLTITFVTEAATARFSRMAAANIIFALANVKPYANNPHR